jgi:hypothetical protein
VADLAAFASRKLERQVTVEEVQALVGHGQAGKDGQHEQVRQGGRDGEGGRPG